MLVRTVPLPVLIAPPDSSNRIRATTILTRGDRDQPFRDAGENRDSGRRPSWPCPGTDLVAASLLSDKRNKPLAVVAPLVWRSSVRARSHLTLRGSAAVRAGENSNVTSFVLWPITRNGRSPQCGHLPERGPLRREQSTLSGQSTRSEDTMEDCTS